MEWAARLAWAALAAIHVMPALALLRPAMLTRLYGLPADSPLLLLMQHRAGLFAAIVMLCIWAIVVPAVRPAALLMTGLSMLSFLWLFLQAGQPAALRPIALVDLAGVVSLLIVGWALLKA